MAGGVAPKTFAQLATARAAIVVAEQALQQTMQMGNPTVSSITAATDTAVTAAIAALTAIT
jgi:hypothetical protein